MAVSTESPRKKKGRKKTSARRGVGRGTRTSARTAGRKRSGAKELDVQVLFQREVQAITDGEREFQRFLPTLEDELRSRPLHECVRWLLDESERYSRSLERVLEEHGDGQGRAQRCEALRGMIREATTGLRNTDASPERDLVTITNLQKILHYSIATYGSLRAWSEVIGDHDAAVLFERLADERGRADRILTDIAEDLFAGRHSRNGGFGARARAAV